MLPLTTFLLDLPGYLLLKRGKDCKGVRLLPKRISKTGRFSPRQYGSSGVPFQKALLSRSWMELNQRSANILDDWPPVCPTRGMMRQWGL